MSWVSNEVVEVLTFLLPGFVAATIFYPLTSHPKPSPFNSVVQALIFTMIVQAIVYLLPLDALSKLLGSKNEEMATATATHWNFRFGRGRRRSRFDRDMGFESRQTAFRIEVVKDHPRDLLPFRVVLLVRKSRRNLCCLAFGRRTPFVWMARRMAEQPQNGSPELGHFRIAEASWLYDDAQVELASVTALVIAVDRVEMVEFVQPEKRTRE